MLRLKPLLKPRAHPHAMLRLSSLLKPGAHAHAKCSGLNPCSKPVLTLMPMLRLITLMLKTVLILMQTPPQAHVNAPPQAIAVQLVARNPLLEANGRPGTWCQSTRGSETYTVLLKQGCSGMPGRTIRGLLGIHRKTPTWKTPKKPQKNRSRTLFQQRERNPHKQMGKKLKEGEVEMHVLPWLCPIEGET
jgi:hypothetical protein